MRSLPFLFPTRLALAAAVATISAGSIGATVDRGSNHATSQRSKDAHGSQEHKLHGAIDWFDGTWDELLVEAKASGRLIFVDVWTTWCGYCKKLHATTFRNAGVSKELRNVLCYSIDAEDPANRTVVRLIKPANYPTLAFLEPDGRLREVLVGYIDPARFRGEVRRIKRNDSTLSSLRTAIETNANDLDARFRLALKLKTIGDETAYRKHIGAIKRLDPECITVPARHIRLGELRHVAAESLDPTALYAFLAQQTDPTILFEGWYAIRQLEGYLSRVARKSKERAEHRTRSFEASRKLWPHVSCENEHYVAIGSDVVNSFFEGRRYLTTEDMEWALEVAEAIAQSAPDDASVLDTLAGALYAVGRRQEARAMIFRCVELEPGNREWKARLREFSN